MTSNDKEKDTSELLNDDPDDETDFLLTDDQITALQRMADTAIEQIDRLQEVAKNLSRITPEEWKTAFKNVAGNIVRTIDPDSVSADLAADKAIKKMLEQIRANDYEQAQETVIHMNAGTFYRLTKELEKQTQAIGQSIIEKIKYYGLMHDNVNQEIIKRQPKAVKTKQKTADGKEEEKITSLQWKFDALNNGKVEVPVYIAITAENDFPIENYNKFDDAVMAAIGTLAHAQNDRYPVDVTTDQLFRVMNGKRDLKRGARPKQAKRIDESMDKMRFSRIYIDRTAEAEMLNYKLQDSRVSGAIIDDNVLHASRITVTLENNKKVRGYRILQEPILYTYNREKNRLFYVPYDLLNVSATTEITENIIEIRNYLLFRIESMYTGALNSNKILFKKIYEETGILPPETRLNRENYKDTDTYTANIRKQRAKDRKKVSEILTDWKEKKYISGFEISNEDNSIRIILNKKILEERAKDKNKPMDPKLLKL